MSGNSDFKYAGISDLNKYFNRASDFDNKVQIFPTLTSGNLHLFRDSGYVDTLFVNSEEIAAAQSTSGAVDSNGEWFYNSETNQVEYYNSNYSSTTINEQVFEAGQDFTTFLNQTLTDASLELHNYLGAKYPTPIEKQNIIDLETADSAVGKCQEYDPILIKATCYIAAANLIRAKEGASEEADYYHSLVTNEERTGLVDKLNDGIYKLSHEVDDTSKKGRIKYRDVSGTMDLVELAGSYSGELYDRIQVEIEATGAYGTGSFKVKSFGDDKLLGTTSDAEIITGGLQYIHGGIYGRWSGASATDGDVWEIELYDKDVKQTNKSNKTIEMIR